MKKKRVVIFGLIFVAILFIPIKNITEDFLNSNIQEDNIIIPVDSGNVIDLEEKNLEVEEIMPEKKDYLAETSYVDTDGKIIVTNLDDIHILVNKERNLTSDYKPNDLVIPNVKFSFEEKLDKRYLREEAAIALENLFEGASNEDITLYAVSGYRSYKTQDGLFTRKVNSVGYEEANKLVAVPGQSEHQTGLSMDVSSKSANFDLTEIFGETVEGIWLKDNAHRFGFIIRYPEDMTHITGYSYEPWHIRYLGIDLAAEVYESSLTLEEFFQN